MEPVTRAKVVDNVARARAKSHAHRTKIGEGVKNAACERELLARANRFAEYWDLGAALNIIDVFESQGNVADEFGADVPGMKARLDALRPIVELDILTEKLEIDTGQPAGSIRSKADRSRAPARVAKNAEPLQAGDMPFRVDSRMRIVYPEGAKSIDRPSEPIRTSQGKVEDGPRRVKRGDDV
jgi:hypothetical protein